MVLCVDEKSQTQALERIRPMLPMMPTVPARQTHNYVQHGVACLFAAFDPAAGTVIGQLHRRHRHQEFLTFLKVIDANTPTDMDLHLVLDNYAAHKTPTVHRWLAAHPCFHLHVTPTSVSWLNLVERWCAELTNRKLRRSSHRSLADPRNRRTAVDRGMEHRPETVRLGPNRRRSPQQPRRIMWPN